MRNRKLYYMLVAVMSASALLFTGCGSKAEPVSAEATEPVSEAEPEESLESTEPTPSPTVEPAEEPVEEKEEMPSEEMEQEESELDLGYEIISIDEVTMYATTNCNLRNGPSTDYDIVDSMTYGESAVFNGYVEEGDSVWYVIKTEDGSIQMVSKSLVSSEKPQPQQSTQPSGGNGSTQQPSGGQPSGDGQPQGNTSTDNPYADSSAPGGFFIPGAGDNAGAGNDSAIGDGSGAGGLDINWQ